MWLTFFTHTLVTHLSPNTFDIIWWSMWQPKSNQLDFSTSLSLSLDFWPGIDFGPYNKYCKWWPDLAIFNLSCYGAWLEDPIGHIIHVMCCKGTKLRRFIDFDPKERTKKIAAASQQSADTGGKPNFMRWEMVRQKKMGWWVIWVPCNCGTERRKQYRSKCTHPT